MFAVDPGMDSELGARVANETVFEVPWEDLSPGPRGEYLEIVAMGPNQRVPRSHFSRQPQGQPLEKKIGVTVQITFTLEL